MCIFSQPVRDVSATQIYAHLQGERQCLVYEMRLSAAADLAMILPLPTLGREEDQAVWGVGCSAGFPASRHDAEAGGTLSMRDVSRQDMDAYFERLAEIRQRFIQRM
jgi:hypothetical protein